MSEILSTEDESSESSDGRQRQFIALHCGSINYNGEMSGLEDTQSSDFSDSEHFRNNRRTEYKTDL